MRLPSIQTLILLNSKTSTFPDGLGNEHGIIGHLYCFFIIIVATFLRRYRASMINIIIMDEGRPKAFMPSFRNLHQQDIPFLEVICLIILQTEQGGQKITKQAGIGEELKSKINDPGPGMYLLVCKVKRYPFIKII